jgi:hypothetical protein
MEKFNQTNENDVSFVVNGNKLNIEKDADMIVSLRDKLPDEALKIIEKMNKYNLIAGLADQSNVKVSFTSEGTETEELANIITLDELILIQQPETNIEFKFSEKTDKSKIINENKGTYLEIKLGETSRKNVLQFMGKYSKENFSSFDNSRSLYYRDLALLVTFDKDDFVEELTFEPGFEGQTIRGLRIGDTIDKAINLYGQPYMRSNRGAIWPNFAVFSKDNFITSIRLQK